MQVLLIIITAVISANLFLEHEMLKALLDMSNLTVQSALITIIYFILGYFIYSLVYALTGSMVSKPEDIQSANGPVSLIAGSIALLFVLVLITAKVAIKVYSSAILNYGSKMSLKDAFKIYKDK